MQGRASTPQDLFTEVASARGIARTRVVAVARQVVGTPLLVVMACVVGHGGIPEVTRVLLPVTPTEHGAELFALARALDDLDEADALRTAARGAAARAAARGRRACHFYGVVKMAPKNVGVYPVQGRSVLLHRRFDGVISTPGGTIDLGEMPEHAAVRELREECGLDVSTNALHPIYMDTYTVCYMVRVTEDPVGPEPAFRDEVDMTYVCDLPGARPVAGSGHAWVPLGGLAERLTSQVRLSSRLQSITELCVLRLDQLTRQFPFRF